MESWSSHDLLNWAHTLLSSNFHIDPSVNPPLPSSIVTKWHQDPHSRGSYAYIPNLPHASPLDLVELSQPVWNQRLGFAGEHTEMDMYASVHGAFNSGKREGERVLDVMRAEEVDKVMENGTREPQVPSIANGADR